MTTPINLAQALVDNFDWMNLLGSLPKMANIMQPRLQHETILDLSNAIINGTDKIRVKNGFIITVSDNEYSLTFAINEPADMKYKQKIVLDKTTLVRKTLEINGFDIKDVTFAAAIRTGAISKIDVDYNEKSGELSINDKASTPVTRSTVVTDPDALIKPGTFTPSSRTIAGQDRTIHAYMGLTRVPTIVEQKAEYEDIKAQLSNTEFPLKSKKNGITSIIDAMKENNEDSCKKSNNAVTAAVAKSKKPAEPKYLYRIRMKGDTKYLSPGYKSKSTWQRASSAIDAIKSHMHGNQTLADYEICMLPVNDPITVSADVFVRLRIEKEKEKALS
ncbi:MAG: hypothetical protein M0R51_02610, partial [Clostridia bacterium]|nr:hypothetical protein [Clostridia bacterium]